MTRKRHESVMGIVMNGKCLYTRPQCCHMDMVCEAISHLREAAQVAADIGLPGEQWQIQAALGSLYEAGGEQAQAHTAFGEAATIIQGLAEGIKDEALRTRFLAAPQIQPVVQQTHGNANAVPQDHAEPSGR